MIVSRCHRLQFLLPKLPFPRFVVSFCDNTMPFQLFNDYLQNTPFLMGPCME